MEQADSPAGPYRSAFAFTTEQCKRMVCRTEAGCDTSTREMFTSLALVPRSDGDHVVVAMGSQGALHRAPGGDWSRVPVLHRMPVSLGGPSWLARLVVSPLALFVLSPVATALASTSSRSPEASSSPDWTTSWAVR